MAIDKDKKWIFIHADKCAGKSIESTLFGFKEMAGSDHKPLTWHTQEVIEDCFKFTIVRNPWDRCVSRWFDYQNRFGGLHKGNTIKEYTNYWYQQCHQKQYWNAQSNCSHMITDHEGKINMDLILRFENLEEDWKKLQKELGIEKELFHFNKNKTPIGHYSEMYEGDDELKAMVHEMYIEDIRQFGYKYETK